MRQTLPESRCAFINKLLRCIPLSLRAIDEDNRMSRDKICSTTLDIGMPFQSLKHIYTRILLLLILTISGLFSQAFAEQNTESPSIAITIDDLPFVGEGKNFHLNMIIDTIKSEEIPATGFVIAGNVRAENWPVLRKFKDAGLGIGNHTLTHANANQMSTDSYIQQIDEADRLLSTMLTKPKYFRFPYLATGQGEKKQNIEAYLASKHYHVAPITIDSKDFIFNQLLLSVPELERRHFITVLKPCYLDYIWQQTQLAEEKTRLQKKNNPAQILLIHSNLLNAYVLPDIIKLYREHGYQFVSLKTALTA
jgi:peptidoglycan/xylan/chitin deacetylase (PgdA/CDA1 family)